MSENRKSEGEREGYIYREEPWRLVFLYRTGKNNRKNIECVDTLPCHDAMGPRVKAQQANKDLSRDLVARAWREMIDQKERY